MKHRKIALAAAAAVPFVLWVLVAPSLAGGAKIEKDYDPVIDPADFVSTIDNPWFPLVPGTTFVYEAETEDGVETNTVEVTHDTKEILGVTCTVVHDRVYDEDGLLTENTYDWYAQDVDGNVWYFGEDSAEYEYDDAGNLVDTSTEGSWEAGVGGAKPGIVMEADPQAGDRYRQEYQEDVAEDMALVMRTNATVENDYGTFKSCVQTKEWSPLEPGEVEQKVYAHGVGFVQGKEFHGGTVTTNLVEILTE